MKIVIYHCSQFHDKVANITCRDFILLILNIKKAVGSKNEKIGGRFIWISLGMKEWKGICGPCIFARCVLTR